MRLLIAETGRPPAEAGAEWPGYPAMFEAMFARVGAHFDCETVPVMDGACVPGPAAGHALLVTGSPAGVYEDHAFIGPLEEAVRRYAEVRVPVVGICFGHQLVAKAFGAPVQKADAGWGVGVHTYEIVDDAPWLDRGQRRFSCVVSHQDQVMALPKGFRRFAGSAFTPFGALIHASLPVLTFQMHPEFDHDFAASLMRVRSDSIPEDRVALGQQTLRNVSDRDLIATWIARFVEGAGGTTRE